MNLNENKYSQYALVKEMLETADTVRRLDVKKIKVLADSFQESQVFLTGEGSSRIFPAKKVRYDALHSGYKEVFYTDGATQALEYNLSDYAVFAASNSGKTKEAVRLIRDLKTKGCKKITGIAAYADTPVLTETDQSFLLGCGAEDAVAATKSVVEQALFYDIFFRVTNGRPLPDLMKLADLITETLTQDVPAEIVDALSKSPVLYVAGRNTGVAEEITLKTNEITRKKSDFMEGTYAVHGIEEVMKPGEAVILMNPFSQEEDKFREVLQDGAGQFVCAVTSLDSSFPSFKIPEYGEFTSYLELVAGWSLLVETGIACGINLDKPERARKVGNEMVS